MPDLRRAAIESAAKGIGTFSDEERDSPGELPSFGASIPRSRRNADYSPLKSDDCFATALEVDIQVEGGTASLRTYYSPPKVPIQDATVMILHHGAGFGGLSFALMARQVTQLTNGELGLLAYDCRGHGRSSFPDSARNDMSLRNLRDDMLCVVQSIFPDAACRPSLLLVGHSMGGAVVVAAAHALEEQHIARVSGVAMIDIVEGTSLQLLPAMGDILQKWPVSFSSVEDAIRWHVESRTIRNAESARRSVPSLVRASGDRWDWQADVLASEPFWKGWFTGLSSSFLKSRTARLLILAETDNLDRELMIGQMQGKYQLVVSPQAGHCVHEDEPESTAATLVHFWRRNEKLRLPIPGLKRVGQS